MAEFDAATSPFNSALEEQEYLAEFDRQHRLATLYFLSKLDQQTTVAVFQSEFEDLIQGVTGLSDPLLISYFISGLRLELRRELLWTCPWPSTLVEAFALARTCEARVEAAQYDSPIISPVLPTPVAPVTPSPPSLSGNTSSPNPYPPPIPLTTLSKTTFSASPIPQPNEPPIPPYPSPSPDPKSTYHSLSPILLPDSPPFHQTHSPSPESPDPPDPPSPKSPAVPPPPPCLIMQTSSSPTPPTPDPDGEPLKPFPDLFSLSKPPPDPPDPDPSDKRKDETRERSPINLLKQRYELYLGIQSIDGMHDSVATGVELSVRVGQVIKSGLGKKLSSWDPSMIFECKECKSEVWAMPLCGVYLLVAVRVMIDNRVFYALNCDCIAFTFSSYNTPLWGFFQQYVGYDNVRLNPLYLQVKMLLSGWVRAKKVDYARKVFAAMSHNSFVSFSAMIQGIATNGLYGKSLQLFVDMQRTYIHLSHWVETALHVVWGSGIDLSMVFEGINLTDLMRHKLNWNCKVLKILDLRACLSLQYIRISATNLLLKSFAFVCCCNTQLIEFSAQFLHSSHLSSFRLDIVVVSALADFCCKWGKMFDARQVFDEIPRKRIASFSTMTYGFASPGPYKEFLQLLLDMQRFCTYSNSVTFIAMLIRVTTICVGDEGGSSEHKVVNHRVSDEVIEAYRSGAEVDISVHNVLIYFSCKRSRIHIAHKILYSVMVKNIVSWTTTITITGYMQNPLDEKVLNMFLRMNMVGFHPDGPVGTRILSPCGSLMVLQQGKQVHGYAVKVNLENDEYVKNGLINMYVKCKSLVDARLVFSVLDATNMVLYNAMIEGYAKQENLSEGFIWFKKMRFESLHPSLFTSVSLLGESTESLVVEWGKQDHNRVIKVGITLDLYAGNAWIDVYSKCSGVDDAKRVFEMKERDLLVWNAMIIGNAQVGQGVEAVKLDVVLTVVLGNLMVYCSGKKWRQFDKEDLIVFDMSSTVSIYSMVGFLAVMILSGERPDQIFDGCLYFHSASNKEEFLSETRQKINLKIGENEKWALRIAIDCYVETMPLGGETNSKLQLLLEVISDILILTMQFNHWWGRPPEDAAWGSFASFSKHCLHHHLEDKVVLKSGEIDTTLPVVCELGWGVGLTRPTTTSIVILF